MSQEGYYGSVRIRVNPDVPGGWYVDDGTCSPEYQYDLKTVLRHELMHGVGVSSSITPDGAGYFIGSQCYPTIFDTLVENEQHEKIVDGCMHTHTSGHSYFVNNVQLYNPPSFNQGSSMSHSAAPGLMWYAIPPMQCLDYDENTWKFLQALNASCNFDTLLPESETETETETEPPAEEVLNDNPQHHGQLSSGSRVKLSIYIGALLVVKWWRTLGT
jgi:hypothetical protein